MQITSLTVGSNGTFSPNAGTLQVLGSFTYTGGAFGSRIINDGSVVLNTSFLPGGGLQNDTSLNVPAGFVVGSPTGGTANTVDNEGTINLAGGTLAGGVSAGDGGPIVNNGLITGYGGLQRRRHHQHAQITQSGGNLTISAGSVAMTNGGGISLASGFQLRLASGTLANSDYINLNAATVAGSGLLDNAGGVVTGRARSLRPF